jgi:hypothetical protein
MSGEEVQAAALRKVQQLLRPSLAVEMSGSTCWACMPCRGVIAVVLVVVLASALVVQEHEQQAWTLIHRQMS